MNGRIEAAQERLERAAFAWQTEGRSGFSSDRYLSACNELDEAITNLHSELDEFLKEKGSIPR